jgi:hypothetical protein
MPVMNGVKSPASAIVRPVEDLDVWATEIGAEHAAGQQATRKGLEHYRRAGEKLIEVREQCQRQGIGFTTWLKDNEDVVGFKTARAYHYVKLAEFLVTRNPRPEEMEAEWRRISGNAKSPDDEQQEDETDSEPATLSLAQRIRQLRLKQDKVVRDACDDATRRVGEALRLAEGRERSDALNGAAGKLIELAKLLIEFAETDD